MGDISTYNGSAAVAMTGKNCVAIAADTRFGVQFQTIGTKMQKTFKMHDRLYLGICGLGTDRQTLSEEMAQEVNLYTLREERDIKPTTFAQLLSKHLYSRRFAPYFVEPIVAGLDAENKPYITAMDQIGAMSSSQDFAVGGTAGENLLGVCESFYREDMNPEELFEAVSQCLLSAVDRDSASGWGAIVHVITPQGVMTKELKVRQD